MGYSGVTQVGQITPGNVARWNKEGMLDDGGPFDSASWVAPTNGFNQVIPDNTRFYIMEPVGILGAGALTMPANPKDGQRLTISSTALITLFTLSPNTGQAIKQPLTSIPLGGFGTWLWVTAKATWYRIG